VSRQAAPRIGDPYGVADFEQFWPHYVRLHTQPQTQLLHAIATCTCAGLVVLGLARQSAWIVALGPLADYIIAQASHRLYERNRTMPWRNTLWHTRGELRMLRLVLTGRMGDEVERYRNMPADLSKP
jgi:hypothetical protein